MDIPVDSRGLENPTSRKGESQWKISLERMLTTKLILACIGNRKSIKD